ncbi:MAG: outer membrane beta-barrel family protein [Bacteroidota bacterium]
MKTLLMLITYLLVCRASFAQKINKISGKVVDEKGIALPYALVRLQELPDSSHLKSSTTTLDGVFNFDQVTKGNYRLLITMMGYKSESIAVNTTDLKPHIIQLSLLAGQLKEVSIEAKRPFIEHRVDKTLINVENSIVATGGTALEILEKAPGVSVDKQNDQIKLNNKSGVTVMIDGRPNVLSGADLTTMLSNMSSEQIGVIEIITNPSAKYDASGNAGIINIKLKRNKNFGTNGSLSSTFSQGIVSGFPADLYRAGLNLNLNHRVEKWNIFGNMAFARKANFNQIEVNRTTSANGLESKFLQNFGRANKGVGYSGKLGADYYVSAKTTIGVMVDANTVSSTLNNFSETAIDEMKGNTANSNSLVQQAGSKTPASNLTANFNIKHDFNKEGKNLTFDADYLAYYSKRDEDFDTKYLDDTRQLVDRTFLRNNTAAQLNVYAIKTDFTLPISKTIGFETGLKTSYVTTNNNFISEQLLNDVWQNNLGKSNHFIYKENINAAYLNFSKKWNKWEVQVGLRAEHTHSKGNSVTDNKEVNRNYISLFPTLFLSQNLDENNNIRYTYGRRVDRPSYQQLNPFVFYMDPYALDQGNPYLRPQFTDNFEVSYSYKDKFSLSLNYSDTRDLIVQLTEQDDVTRIVKVVRGNIGRSQNYSSGIYLPFNLAKWWNMQNNLSIYYNRFSDGNLSGGQYNASKVAYNFNTSSSFRLPLNISIELNFWLNSPRVFGLETTTAPQYALNIGAQKSLLNKKLKLRLNMDDVFLTNQWQGNIIYQNLNLHIKNSSTSRRASFNISYSFGNQNVKSARNRKTATDDIKSRAGGN